MENTTTWESLRGDSLKLCMRFERDSYQRISLPKTNLFYRSSEMRKTISDEIIEIAKKHKNLNERIEIYWKMMAYYIEWVIVDERMKKYLDPNVWRSEKMKDKKNRLGRTKNKTWQDLNLRDGRTKKNSRGTTKNSKSKPKKSDISESDLTIYISNNKWLYDIVCKYIDVDKGNIQYIIDNKYNKSYNKYIYSQMLEAKKIIKEIWLENFTATLDFISKDDFRSQQILTIAKLNRKNKDWIPYYLVIKDKMKPHTIRNLERERQAELHRQKIREQIESFKSETKQNAETWLQNGWYNRRQNIRLSDIPW